MNQTECDQPQVAPVVNVCDFETTETRTNSALLGMLILRDDAPAKTAGCSRATRAATRDELQRHVLACPRCREIADLVRRGPRRPVRRVRDPEPTAVAGFRRSARLVDDGFVLINTGKAIGDLHIQEAVDRLPEHHVATVAATELAVTHLGRPTPNTVLLGALTAFTEVIQLASVEQAISTKFEGDVAQRNIAIVDAAVCLVDQRIDRYA